MSAPNRLSCFCCLPNLMAKGDHRCRVDHVHGIVPASSSYPTIEWMRGDAGPCGPEASAWRDPPVGGIPPEIKPQPQSVALAMIPRNPFG